MKQVRNTPTKQFILGLISDAGRALSQAEIQEQTEGKCDRVTVYRVLDRLENEGDIHRVVHLDGVVRFAKCNSCEGEGHAHGGPPAKWNGNVGGLLWPRRHQHTCPPNQARHGRR